MVRGSAVACLYSSIESLERVMAYTLCTYKAGQTDSSIRLCWWVDLYMTACTGWVGVKLTYDMVGTAVCAGVGSGVNE